MVPTDAGQRRLLIALVSTNPQVLLVHVKNGATLLMLAAALASTQELDALLKLKPDIHAVNAHGETALHYVLTRELSASDMVAPLLAHFVKITRSAAHLLPQCALTTAHIPVPSQVSPRTIHAVGQLKDLINTANGYGQTPLMFAIASGKRELAQLLLDYGAHRTAVDVYGLTAVGYALLTCRPDLMRLLVPPGKTLSPTDQKIMVTLMRAPLTPVAHARLKVIQAEWTTGVQEGASAQEDTIRAPKIQYQWGIEDMHQRLIKAVMRQSTDDVALLKRMAERISEPLLTELTKHAKEKYERETKDILAFRATPGDTMGPICSPDQHPTVKCAREVCRLFGATITPPPSPKQHHTPSSDSAHIHPAQMLLEPEYLAEAIVLGNLDYVINLVSHSNLTCPYLQYPNLVAWAEDLMKDGWNEKEAILTCLRTIQTKQQQNGAHKRAKIAAMEIPAVAIDLDATIEQDEAWSNM